MTPHHFVAIGECMIEMSGGAGDQWKLGIAGDTLNTAWHFRNATPADDWHIRYVTALGDDRYSDRIAQFISDAGIETGAIRRLSGKRPGLYLIDQEGGADVLYLSGITLAILAPERRAAFIDLLKPLSERTRIAFDPNIRPALWESEEACKAAISSVAAMSEFILPSFDDEAALFGDHSLEETVARYRDLGVREVVVKNAGNPCTFLSEDQVKTIATPQVSKIVDATGAGDSFNAAFLATRLSGMGCVDAIRAGQALSAKVIQTHGALVV